MNQLQHGEPAVQELPISTVFPLDDKDGIMQEFDRAYKRLSVPSGVVVEWYGNHTTPPLGWISIDTDKILSKVDYADLYRILQGTEHITADRYADFIIAARRGFIMKV